MDGCIYRTKDGECDLYSEGGKFKAFCDPEHCDNIAPTNADRIRAMSDAELATIIFCGNPCVEKSFNTESELLKWLKSEAKE